jgi:hypothetical protein
MLLVPVALSAEKDILLQIASIFKTYLLVRI